MMILKENKHCIFLITKKNFEKEINNEINEYN